MPASSSPKGRARREGLLEAALRIIGRDGLTRLSMRALAREAGQPLGAVGYYFDGKEQLVEAAFAFHAERELRRVMREVTPFGLATSPDDLARRLTVFVLDGLRSAEASHVAEYEFLVEASRRPELARASTAWQQALRAQLVNVVRGLGAAHPETDAGVILAVVAGLEVDRLRLDGPSARDAEEVAAALTRLLGALAESWRTSGR